MAEVTVAQFADVLKVPVEKLLSQLDEAGIRVKGSEDTISEDAKLELLTHLRRSHGQDDPLVADGAPRRITLRRKSQSELRLAGVQGRSRARFLSSLTMSSSNSSISTSSAAGT